MTVSVLIYFSYMLIAVPLILVLAAVGAHWGVTRQSRLMVTGAWSLALLVLAPSYTGVLIQPDVPLLPTAALLGIAGSASAVFAAMTIIPWQERRSGKWGVLARAGWWFKAAFGIVAAPLVMYAAAVMVWLFIH